MNSAANAKLQFRVLYRQFLFRVVDLEILSADALGDANKLLGQFAALLILVSIIWSFGAFGIIGANNMPPETRASLTLFMTHFLVATTMLVVGIFAVLSWDSIFPDRRDVLVLAPLPVRPRTMFLAKVAATGTALSLVVVLLNCATGLAWPFALAVPVTAPLGFLRSLAAYWFTMFAAGIFIYCAVLALQGLAAQFLPRHLFLRASGFLQMAAFCLFVCAYFLEPPVDGLKMLTAPQNRHLLACLPSYWFFGLFHQLNGSMHPVLAPLARRAWIGLTIAGLAAAAAYALSYMRTMRQIVEAPDIAPGSRGLRWLPRFGDSLQTAIVQFCIRTLARSRQHRLILAFYLGIGLAFTISLLQFLASAPQPPGSVAINAWHQANVPLLTATIMMTVLAVLGARVVFALPLELRANWIFRAVGMHDAGKILIASRRALLLISIVPVWLVSAAACFWLWPWRQAAAHLAVLALIGIILADLCLWGFRKIPFTCSYLPGKSQVHIVIIAVVVLLMLVAQSVIFEQQALQRPAIMAVVLVLLGTVAIGIRWHIHALAKSDEEELRFEEIDPAALVELGLSSNKS
ncbi:MAG TPA: hypothetical protein VGR93_09650 [Candidatus Acidoferrales bacterium]|nr:hypothetical protein [Candidatus Acidoferrales bacterium]